jgi:hypothetical protein
MGTELICDIWLARAASHHGEPGVAARMLLRTQILTHNRTGHLLAFNDELPRRRIQKALQYGGLPRIYVRCLRCGCTAELQAWIAAAPKLREERIAVASALGRHMPAGGGDYLLPCEATSYLAHLESLVREPAGTESQ